MRRRLRLLAALLVVSCGGTVGLPGDRPDAATGSDGSSDGPALTLGVDIEPGERTPDPGGDPLSGEIGTDPQYVELVGTGFLEGEFSTFPACSDRDVPGGRHLHVFFVYQDESREKLPSVDVLMRFRPFEFEGPFEFTSDGTPDGDLEVTFFYADFSELEPLQATISGTVRRTEAASGLPVAEISFTGSYEGEIGSGTFEGTLACIAVPDPE